MTGTKGALVVMLALVVMCHTYSSVSATIKGYDSRTNSFYGYPLNQNGAFGSRDLKIINAKNSRSLPMYKAVGMIDGNEYVKIDCGNVKQLAKLSSYDIDDMSVLFGSSCMDAQVQDGSEIQLRDIVGCPFREYTMDASDTCYVTTAAASGCSIVDHNVMKCYTPTKLMVRLARTLSIKKLSLSTQKLMTDIVTQTIHGIAYLRKLGYYTWFKSFTILILPVFNEKNTILRYNVRFTKQDTFKRIKVAFTDDYLMSAKDLFTRFYKNNISNIVARPSVSDVQKLTDNALERLRNVYTH